MNDRTILWFLNTGGKKNIGFHFFLIFFIANGLFIETEFSNPIFATFSVSIEDIGLVFIDYEI